LHHQGCGDALLGQEADQVGPIQRARVRDAVGKREAVTPGPPDSTRRGVFRVVGVVPVEDHAFRSQEVERGGGGPRVAIAADVSQRKALRHDDDSFHTSRL
jgi:hypothetical protein